MGLFPYLSIFDLGILYYNKKKIPKMDYDIKNDDFVILIPIWGDIRYLSHIDFLKRYGNKVYLCTTNKETKEFYEELNRITQYTENNVLHIEIKDNDLDKRNAWWIYDKAIKSLITHDLTIREALNQITASYVFLVDGDTYPKDDLGIITANMDLYKYDLASLRVIPSKANTIAENLQYIEYHVAMKSRKVYPHLTSGAGIIGKREVLKDIFSKHSLFFSSGDIEVGKLANLLGYKVGHLESTFYTDVPQTFDRLFKQRTMWFSGLFRNSILNIWTNIFTPFLLLYTAFIIYFLLPFKLMEGIHFWYLLPYIVLGYLVLNYASNWELRNNPFMLLFPIYALLQIIIMPVFGIIKYLDLVIKTNNFGFMRVHYKKNYSIHKYITNITFIIFVLFIYFYFRGLR